MKATDYIVEFFISKGITDVFGFPGGVICHFMDSITKYNDKIQDHINYHEQASSFAACGYAQASLKPGVAYATSGPGATNLITGISNAYFDSIPTIFITGQVDTYAAKGDLEIRQKGFQETDIVSMVKAVTKYSVSVESPDKLQEHLEMAYFMATSGRPGPVLLDIPADIQRSDIDINVTSKQLSSKNESADIQKSAKLIIDAIKSAKRPCLLIGSGVKQSGLVGELKSLLEKVKIPIVTSMIAFDVLSYDHPQNYGFVGSNGHRYANFTLGKSDLVVTLGSRLDSKQVGAKREQFASQAKLIRVDIDPHELELKVKEDELQIVANIKELLPEINRQLGTTSLKYSDWNQVCKKIRKKLVGYDHEVYHKFIEAISKKIPDDTLITADVGHHQVWVAQSYQTKENQSVYFSGGLGSMGYALPAAIGASYGDGRAVVCINGDGGIQMNIQELQFVAREKLPMTIIVINNSALGMIRHFQEMNFDKNYTKTTVDSGYTVPDFGAVAKAYGLDYQQVNTLDDIEKINFGKRMPLFVEVCMPINTYLMPKFNYGRPNQDQSPEIDRDLYNYLMEL